MRASFHALSSTWRCLAIAGLCSAGSAQALELWHYGTLRLSPQRHQAVRGRVRHIHRLG